MSPAERKNFAEWLLKWRDVDYVNEKARIAGVCIKNADDAVAFCDVPLKVASLLAGPDYDSGLVDMQIWFVRIAHEAKLRGITV